MLGYSYWRESFPSPTLFPPRSRVEPIHWSAAFTPLQCLKRKRAWHFQHPSSWTLKRAKARAPHSTKPLRAFRESSANAPASWTSAFVRLRRDKSVAGGYRADTAFAYNQRPRIKFEAAPSPSPKSGGLPANPQPTALQDLAEPARRQRRRARIYFLPVART